MGFPEEYASADFDSVDEPVTTDYVPYESVGQDEVAAPPGGFPQWGEDPVAEVPEPADDSLFSIFGGMIGLPLTATTHIPPTCTPLALT